MKLKIKNFPRFVCSLVIIIGLTIGVTVIFSNLSTSNGELAYKTITVSNGDTLWNIAKELKNNDEYFSNKDIREIVYNIKKVNKIEDSNLQVGQDILIPII
jgi:LysM domain.